MKRDVELIVSAEKDVDQMKLNLFVDERSVLVRVTETLKSRNMETSVVHIEHVDLF